MSDIDAATLNQLNIDRAEAAYDEQCWREDRDELLGLNEHPTLEEFQQHMADAKKASQECDHQWYHSNSREESYCGRCKAVEPWGD